MNVGDVKTVVLRPEDAYGYPSQEYVQVIERNQRSPIVQNVSIEKFRDDIGLEPSIGLEFRIPEAGEFDMPWAMQVLDIQGDTVTFRFIPEEGTTMTTVFGEADIFADGDEIVIRINPVKGQSILTLVGPAKVLDVTEDEITVDFNHELAGLTLEFEVRLLELQRG
jgi:FKBP-type peptidyl-prolyl cis-trans isomerase 2